MATPTMIVDAKKLRQKAKFDVTRQELLARIDQRRKDLQRLARKLKSHFVGLNEIIDKIIENIEVWYIMPELITRPVIVNLWGMTGVGKTDLVRKLVKSLDFSDNFVEIQLTNKGSSSDLFSSTIQSILSFSNLEPGQPGVLLLDEIQRFRSVNEEGQEIHSYRFQDVWMLLSDGRFSGASDGKERLLQMLFDHKYWADYQESEEDEEETEAEAVTAPGTTPEASEAPKPPKKKKRKHRTYHQTYYESRRLKRLLKLPQPVEDIMTWSDKKKNAVLITKINDQSLYEGDDYSKLLIFVCGNLDEAYDMSGTCEEVNIDADVLHKFSLKINLLNIKKALKQRFKPEQIARLGNSHVIYPSLSKKSYERIIERKIKEATSNIYHKFGIKIRADQSIKDFIYRNGVYPTQGVRPVFSTISSSLETALPTLIFEAIEKNVAELDLFYENNCICAKIGSEIYSLERLGDLDRIRKIQDPNLRTYIAVHEAGHALAYLKLFGVSPTEVKVNTATFSGGENAFMGSHHIFETHDSMLDIIAMNLAGRVAERLIFGDGQASAGAAHDIRWATKKASSMVRSYGMKNFKTERVNPNVNAPGVGYANYDTESTDDVIERIVREQEFRVQKMLELSLDLLKDLADKLILHGGLDRRQLAEICGQHGLGVKALEADKEVVNKDFTKEYADFCEKTPEES